MKSFQQDLDFLRQSVRDVAPPEHAASYDRALTALSRSGIAERALRAGDRAPAFSLPDRRGNPVHLSGRLRSGPVVLCFFRGTWCPFCAFELTSLEGSLRQIREHGATLLAVSPQSVPCGDGVDRVDCDSLHFDILHDAENRVAAQFGIVFRLHDEIQAIYADLGIDLPGINRDDSFNLPVPATYVIDRNGIIRLASVDPDYTRRLDPAEILAALRSLSDSP